MESYLSGYCRTIDASRMVLVEDGEADCDYERCGYRENPYAHVHPPYHRGSHGHDLVIMTCPEAISSETYNDFAAYLKNTVMKDVF